MTARFEIIKMPPPDTDTCSVLVSSGGLATIFDPWGPTDDWVKLLRERNLKLHALYCTHGHFDHILAVPDLAAMGVPWYMHPDDNPVIEWSNGIFRRYGAKTIDLQKIPPVPLTPGIMEVLPGLPAEVIHLPGHSAGGVAFYFDSIARDNAKAVPLLIIGDTLFQDSFGRTDVITGSDCAMKESLHKLAARDFPPETVVIHGHGMDTTIEWLCENNPFLR